VLLSKDDVDQMTRGENSLCNCITATQVDGVGRAWVGTPEGLWYLEHNVWRKCQPGIELGSPLVNIQAIAFAPATHKLWVGGWREDGPRGNNGNGLRQFVGTTEVPLVGEMPELPYVDTLTCDVQGCVWVAAEGIVHCFDGEQWKQLPLLPDEAASEFIQALTVDERGVLWCGTTGGLWRYDGKWRREDVDVPVQALAHKGKDVWVGTTAGLKRLSGRRKRRWVSVDSFPGAAVTALAIDQDGILWVGTTCGLTQLQEREFPIWYTGDSGLASNYVRVLAVGDYGTLWVGTANGASQFNPRSTETS
jgi:ligand-binding sensor domain-containing protein